MATADGSSDSLLQTASRIACDGALRNGASRIACSSSANVSHSNSPARCSCSFHR
jgi:hypothetical protein